MKGYEEITWDELADIYDRQGSGRKARTLPMEAVFAWAVRQKNQFKVGRDGTLYIKKEVDDGR